MKSRLNPPKRKFHPEEWHRKFAWRPMWVPVSEFLTPADHHPAYIWVWLECYERRVWSHSYDAGKLRLRGWPWGRGWAYRPKQVGTEDNQSAEPSIEKMA